MERNGSRAPGRAGIIRVDGVAMLAPLGLILVLLAFQLVDGYHAALRSAQSTVTSLADVLSLNISNTMERLGGDLNGFAADLSAENLDAPLPVARRQALKDRMSAALLGFDVVTSYHLFDVQGNAVLGAARESAQNDFNVADRKWFQTLRTKPGQDAVLSEVVVSKSTGLPGMVFAHAIRGPDGSFRGALGAHMELGWFQALIDHLEIGREGLVTLRHRDDARLIVRRPRVEAEVNANRSGLLDLHMSDVSSAQGQFRSAIDGIERIYAFRGLDQYPLAVVVAVSPADYLRAWKAQTIVTVLVALLLGAVQVTAYRRLSRAYRSSVSLARELERANTNLERSNAELEEFAYVASHDLQTPLRNISCFSQLLARRAADRLDGECAEFLGFITGNAKRMSELILDLLTYARVSRQQAAPEPEPVAEAIAQTLKDVEADIAACGAVVTVGPLPAVPVSRSHLESLFGNLLSNSLKYRSPERRLEISITATATKRGMWEFAVSDNGIGIEPEYWEKIFAIFQRLHTEDKYEGSGIGLALCRRIVHHWGGEIWVTSEPGTGSIFHFTLPGDRNPQ